MKLTWFGATCLRVYIGGSILVVDAERAPGGIDRAELVAGTDRVFSLEGGDLREIAAAKWRPRKAVALIDEAEEVPAVEVYRIGVRAVLVDAVGEPPLVLIGGEAPRFGRWVDDAVVVLFGAGEMAGAIGTALLDVSRPKLIALADAEDAIDGAVEALREHLEGAGLIALEEGMAVEV
jgi:hypothetical protein